MLFSAPAATAKFCSPSVTVITRGQPWCHHLQIVSQRFVMPPFTCGPGANWGRFFSWRGGNLT